MTEAIFGLIGVFVGSLISWLQVYWVEKRNSDKSARYLAIRVVCILDKFFEDCGDVIHDNGLHHGQRNIDGELEPQVKAPNSPVFPDDVDWKSIDHELMYQILSLPAEVENAERLINGTTEFSGPPDFEEWFIERKFHFSALGLYAYKLSNDLCNKYNIQKKIYNNWNPEETFKKKLKEASKKRQEIMDGQIAFIEKVKSIYNV